MVVFSVSFDLSFHKLVLSLSLKQVDYLTKKSNSRNPPVSWPQEFGMDPVPSFSHLPRYGKVVSNQNTTNSTTHNGPSKGQHVSVMYVPVTPKTHTIFTVTLELPDSWDPSDRRGVDPENGWREERVKVVRVTLNRRMVVKNGQHISPTWIHYGRQVKSLFISICPYLKTWKRNSSFLFISLSSHRYSYISLLFRSRFIDS